MSLHEAVPAKAASEGANPCSQVARLESLLAKSIAYSEFLANKIKKEGDDGAVSVKDGSIAGVGLSQPKLVEGEMRPYQLVRVICVQPPVPAVCDPPSRQCAYARPSQGCVVCGSLCSRWVVSNPPSFTRSGAIFDVRGLPLAIRACGRTDRGALACRSVREWPQRHPR